MASSSLSSFWPGEDDYNDVQAQLDLLQLYMKHNDRGTSPRDKMVTLLHCWREYSKFTRLINSAPSFTSLDNTSVPWCKRILPHSFSEPFTKCSFVPCNLVPSGDLVKYTNAAVSSKASQIVQSQSIYLSSTFYCRVHGTFHSCTCNTLLSSSDASAKQEGMRGFDFFSDGREESTRFSMTFSYRDGSKLISIVACRCEAISQTVRICPVTSRPLLAREEKAVTPIRKPPTPLEAKRIILTANVDRAASKIASSKRSKRKLDMDIADKSVEFSKFIFLEIGKADVKKFEDLLSLINRWMLLVSQGSEKTPVNNPMQHTSGDELPDSEEVRVPMECETENLADDYTMALQEEEPVTQTGNDDAWFYDFDRGTNITTHVLPLTGINNGKLSRLNLAPLPHIPLHTSFLQSIFTNTRSRVLNYNARCKEIAQILTTLFYSNTRTLRYEQIVEKKPAKASKAVMEFWKMNIAHGKIPPMIEAFLVYEDALTLPPHQSPALIKDNAFVNKMCEVIYRQWLIFCLSPYGLSLDKKVDFSSVVLALLYSMKRGGRTWSNFIIVSGDPYVEKYLFPVPDLEQFGFKRKAVTDGNDMIGRVYESLHYNDIEINF